MHQCYGCRGVFILQPWPVSLKGFLGQRATAAYLQICQADCTLLTSCCMIAASLRVWHDLRP